MNEEEEHTKIKSIYEKPNRPERRRPIGKSKNDEGKQEILSLEVSEDEGEVSNDESETKLHSNVVCNKPLIFWGLGVGVLISILAVVYYNLVNNEPTSSDWRNEINNMLRKFPNQPEDYKFHLFSGIQRNLENPSKPSTFLFVHNENEGRTSKLLAYEYAAIAVGAMGTKSPPVCLTYDKLKNLPNFENDYGWIIEHYKPKIQDHGVLIVLDLEKMPGNLAQAFHFLCDEFTPAVKKSIYIFTLKYNSTLSSNPVTAVEEILRNNWKTFLDEDLIQPLITRITNSVLVIQKESLEINNVPKFCE